jgi:hypothetical protein
MQRIFPDDDTRSPFCDHLNLFGYIPRRLRRINNIYCCYDTPPLGAGRFILPYLYTAQFYPCTVSLRFCPAALQQIGIRSGMVPAALQQVGIRAGMVPAALQQVGIRAGMVLAALQQVGIRAGMVLAAMQQVGIRAGMGEGV